MGCGDGVRQADSQILMKGAAGLIGGAVGEGRDPPVGVGWPGGEARTCLLGQLTHSPHLVMFLFPAAVLLFQGSPVPY